jgi:hypothetical protein
VRQATIASNNSLINMREASRLTNGTIERHEIVSSFAASCLNYNFSMLTGKISAIVWSPGPKGNAKPQ